MYIHNTTFVVDRNQLKQFDHWARTEFMPAARNSGVFETVTMARILTEVSPEAVNFAIQFASHSLEQANRWHDEVASQLKSRLSTMLGHDRVLFFSTDMEVIE